MFRTRYRAGMEPQETELLRKLRGRGFAVAIFPPIEVGEPLNRKEIEDEMVKAGRNTIKQLRGQS
jgi:uroporphyrinogen-III synthase